MSETTKPAPSIPISPPETQHPCLLCGHAELKLLARLTCDEVVKNWSIFNVTFSAEALDVFQGRSWIELQECRACGFRFFDPGLAGNGAFYSELQRQIPSYYAADRPDFDWALSCARRHRLLRVLDVGCGTGAFLDRARSAGLQTFGMEMNPVAAAACREKGHTVFSGLMSELLRDQPGERFDLVTSFQVVEHVSNPQAFLHEAAALARPGGFVAISVPNEQGIIQICPNEPHQWPPHHVTRWRRQDLSELGRRCGLPVIDLGGDRMLGGTLEHFWGLHNRLARLGGRKPHPGGRFLPWLLSIIYRKTGCRYYFPAWGPNSFALYQRPATTAPAP